jgi:ABC-type histidine transport system ATPase subunit
MTIKLAVTNLQKYFGPLHVLKGVSLTAKQGEVLALLGSSGSGKSTLLRCINLLEKPDSGQVNLAGIDLDFTKQHSISADTIQQVRLTAGMVFQQFNLWPHLTILENLITAPVCVLKEKKKVAIAHAKELLAKVGIENKANSYPHQLSGGQQQRAAIARSLMMRPQIMLFDEATSALDPEMTNEVLKVIKGLAADGMTIVIATHEIGFAKEVATHAVFLEQGVIVEQGHAKEMLTKPQTARLQQFLESVHY